MNTTDRAAADGGRPTIVLVHGSFADSSGWTGVIQQLQKDDYSVIAASNPLRSLSSDSAYIASFLKSIEGPIVLAAHSYGGAVITNAAAGNPDVKALVYIAGFAPAPGETVFELVAKFPGSEVTDATLTVFPFKLPNDEEGVDTYINTTKYPEVFAPDVAEDLLPALAASQRPATLATGEEGSVGAAWETIPSWYMVTQDDRVIPPDAQRFMASRAGSATVEVKSSHAAMVSHPAEVADLIETAAQSVSSPARV